jgi:autophagy-related protein 18
MTDVSSAEPFLADDGAASIVEMLFCTSLVAVVGAGDKPSASPRRLQIVNTKVWRFQP